MLASRLDHPYFSLPDYWERPSRPATDSSRHETCKLARGKTSKLSDATSINMYFYCLLHFRVPKFLTLVEISKNRHHAEEKYFYDREFMTIRLVLYKPP